MKEFAKEFYKSREWKKCREAYAKSKNFLCEACLSKGIYKPGEIVHHKIHVEPETIQDPEVLFNWDNLELLCRDCHAKQHEYSTKKRYRIDKDGRVKVREPNIKPQKETILVCGLPGTGKTVYAQSHLGNGIVYDLDAIASAFRLRMPHEENHQASREMANSLLNWFLLNAGRYTNRIIIIRTAPMYDELEMIRPSEVVICTTVYVDRGISTDKANSYISRIKQIENYCKERGIPFFYS